MKRTFIIKLTSYLAFVLLLHLLAGFVAGPRLDNFYQKMASPKESNLILGSSRASQGIIPEILGESEDISFFNYAFTTAHSPHGIKYFESIKNKIDTSSYNQTSIVCVSPWTISSLKTAGENLNKFRENGSFINATRFNYIRPNWEYLYKWYYKGWGRILLDQYFPNDSTTYLHDDGWLEVSIPMSDSAVDERTKKKVEAYEKNLETYQVSEIRVEYLQKTVLYLSRFGRVFLVRIPVSKAFYGIDQKLCPGFDNIIDSVANATNTVYINLATEKQMSFTDGNHLHKSSSATFSRILANRIRLD